MFVGIPDGERIRFGEADRRVVEPCIEKKLEVDSD
jgi:hypothetical protein